MRIATTLLIAAAVAGAVIATPSVAFAQNVASGFTANAFPANDDGATGAVSLGFNANYFGTTYS